MNTLGGKIKWVAMKGLANDWTIYYATYDISAETIGITGHKVYHDKVIKKCVPCDDEVFYMYKYES